VLIDTLYPVVLSSEMATLSALEGWTWGTNLGGMNRSPERPLAVEHVTLGADYFGSMPSEAVARPPQSRGRDKQTNRDHRL
jgi:hypothetical protein